MALYVEHVSDAEAERLIRNKRNREWARVKRATRPPDTRPFCAENSGTWHCPNRATTQWMGLDCCKIHASMFASAPEYHAKRLGVGRQRQSADIGKPLEKCDSDDSCSEAK